MIFLRQGLITLLSSISSYHETCYVDQAGLCIPCARVEGVYRHAQLKHNKNVAEKSTEWYGWAVIKVDIEHREWCHKNQVGRDFFFLKKWVSLPIVSQRSHEIAIQKNSLVLDKLSQCQTEGKDSECEPESLNSACWESGESLERPLYSHLHSSIILVKVSKCWTINSWSLFYVTSSSKRSTLTQLQYHLAGLSGHVPPQLLHLDSPSHTVSASLIPRYHCFLSASQLQH